MPKQNGENVIRYNLNNLDENWSNLTNTNWNIVQIRYWYIQFNTYATTNTENKFAKQVVHIAFFYHTTVGNHANLYDS